MTAEREGPVVADPGSADAFVRAHELSLLRTAYLLTGDRERARDVVQTALQRVVAVWDRQADWASPVAYARRVVVNVVASDAARRWRGEVPTAELPELPERPPGVDATPADEVAADRDLLRRALATLPERQRTAVVLRFYLDLSERAAAEAMDVPPGTLKSLTSRGIAALRTTLEDDR